MPITDAQRNRAKARIAAKEFVALVRESRMAHNVPDQIFEAVPEGYEKDFRDCLIEHRLRQRPDWLWEDAR